MGAVAGFLLQEVGPLGFLDCTNSRCSPQSIAGLARSLRPGRARRMIRQHHPGRPLVLMSSTSSQLREPIAVTTDRGLSARDTWRLVLAVAVPFWGYMAL